ncbi:hypothetical protein LEP1GSC168_0742 [Leptospira santarosai str. HAI134]|nr:hypothetical protein LEP1GSC168_0742 [Leptospira santarosai str. HAI134]
MKRIRSESISLFVFKRTKIEIEIGLYFSNIPIVCANREPLFQRIGYQQSGASMNRIERF